MPTTQEIKRANTEPDYNISDEISNSFFHAMMSVQSFVSGYYVDLNEKRYYAIEQKDIYKEKFNTSGEWARMDDYIRECIHPDDQALITEVSRIDYIRDRLKKEHDFSIVVRDHGTGSERWYRYTTVRGDDENHAIIVFRDITETVERENELEHLNRQLEENQAELEASTAEQEAQIEEISALNDNLNTAQENLVKAFGITEALAASFKNVYLIDKKNRTVEVRKLGSYMPRTLNLKNMNVYDYDLVVETYINERVYEDDKPLVTQLLNWDYMLKAITENEAYQFTYRVMENGMIHFYQGRFRNIDDQFIGCGFQNIDETVAEEREYNEIIANAGFGVWHIYLKDGEAPRMQANEKMAELLGINTTDMTEEQIYDAWYSRITPDAIPSVQKSVGEMLDGKFSENTYIWTHPVKGDIYVRCGGTCVKRPDGTNMLRGYHADVTEIVFEEQRHEQELEKARQVAEEAHAKVAEAYGMIFGLSQEYHTIWVVSKETSKMRLIRSSGVSTIKNAVQMGFDLPEFDSGFDKYINTYVEPEDRERMHREIAFAEILRQLQEHPNKLYAVNYLRRDDSGHVGYHQIAFANADSENGKKQFVYGFRDIDEMVKEEQKQKEELRRAKEEADSANAAKTSFLFNMSHDIRTPMNAIMGFRDLLEKHQDDPVRRADYLRKIDDSSKILLSIINNVLEMARIEKGTLEIDETAWSAEQFNDTLYSVFRDMMEHKDITFTRQIEVKNNYVFCDPIKLREIFINILSNAYKYTNRGGKVNMHLEEIPSDREGWALYQTTITDTGIGMSEEFLPHIFEEFAREQNTTEIKIEGTGLGMPIVKRLVDMLDGTIEVRSKKDEGSTFIVTIPHRIADKSHLVEHAGVELDPKLFNGKRILLAEDNNLNAEIAMEILGEAGFVIDHAEDGVICCNMLDKAPDGYYDAILMDVQMPRMNGYEATRKIRSMADHAKSQLPILAMTANAFEDDKREALRAGMNGHIAKPINVSVLMKELAYVLG